MLSRFFIVLSLLFVAPVATHAENTFFPTQTTRVVTQSSWENHSLFILDKLSNGAQKLVATGNMPAILISKTSNLEFPEPKLNLVQSTKLLAYADCDSKTITISDKTLESLKSDSELAFILAHELGHLYYCHSAPELSGFILSDFQKSIIEETHKRWEIEADSFAIATLKQTNYSASESINLLERVEDSANIHGTAIHHHPSVKDRTDLIRKDLFILASKAE